MATTKDGAQLLEDEVALQKTLKSEEYRKLFYLPAEELLIADFNCALQKKILLQGHMYLFEHYVCFYSNILGYEKKKVIPLKDVTCVRKARTVSVFPNAIEIVSWGKKHFFASFLSRDEAFRLIIDGWVQHSSYAKLFLDSQGSLATLATSPQVRTSGAERGAASQNALQSPLLITRIDVGGNYESRVNEMAANIAASAEIIDHGPSNAMNEQDEGHHLLEDEGTTSSSGSVGLQQSPVWEVDDSEAPPLKDSYKTVVESEFPVDVEEFFQLFFSDEGIGFAKDFHTKCGDDDFRCTQWAKHRHFGHARDISFRHPINFYFGPKSTYCHEAQRFRVYRNNHLVLETSQQMTDIPYGDYFKVEVRWDVERFIDNGQFHSLVRVSLDVTFSKKTMWKSKIEQGTYDESKEAYTTWIQLARDVVGGMKSSTSKHLQGHEVPAAECSRSDEPLERANGPSETYQELHDADSLHTCSANRISDSQEELDWRSQLKWTMKASSAIQNALEISQRGWQMLAASDRRKHIKLVLFILAAVLIFSMQIGMIVTLIWPPSIKPAPIAHHVSDGINPGSCWGRSEMDETLGWMERRVRYIKEEIAMTELRLQDLHQHLSVLKNHADQFQNHLSQASLVCRTEPHSNSLYSRAE
uniref:VASt domain-containing protein n=1 Tax=Physcomitrium patens TaxID=3218 RepID=A0A7I4EKP1_PHYPA